MIRKIILASLIVSQFTISCSKDDETTDDNLSEQINNLMNLPYSSLTPEQQKAKLETEANQMLTQLDATKNSVSIDALDNLSTLLEISPIDALEGTDTTNPQALLNVTETGVYTWDSAKQIWAKTDSGSELKFVFPSGDAKSANNSSFTSKNTPTGSNAALTINNTETATFTQTVKYSPGKETPDELGYKMTIKDGYAWEVSSKNGAESSGKAAFTYKGKNLLEFNSGGTDKIDALLDPELGEYKGKANGYIKIMDNFAIVSQTDFAAAAIDDANLEKSLPAELDYENKDYFKNLNDRNLKESQGAAANFNKNTKAVLVSVKDGTKIADVVQHSEKDESSSYTTQQKWVVDNTDPNGGYWDWDPNASQPVNYYQEVNYLKFKDGTEVAMSAYFGEVFDTMENKFNDFLDGF